MTGPLPEVSTDKIETFLDLFSRLNNGCDHGTTYCLARLSDAGTLQQAVESLFHQLYATIPPEPPPDWQVRLGEPAADWRQALSEVAHSWFFQQQYSPRLQHPWDEYPAPQRYWFFRPDPPVPLSRTNPDRDGIMGEITARFCELLAEELGELRVQEVFITPPVFYELGWQDFALSGEQGRWLLHFGFSD